jgi:hypothetical protein
MSSIETNMKGMHEEIKKVSDVLIKLAEMRGDYRVLDQRLLAVGTSTRAGLDNRAALEC